MDEATDAYQRSVANTLFACNNNTKLVSVDFLAHVNNVTVGHTLVNIRCIYEKCYLIKTLLEKVKEMFTRSPARLPFKIAHQKFAAHISSHHGCPLFSACRIFDPKFIQFVDLTQRDIAFEYTYMVEQSLSKYNAIIDDN
nr:8791_t:CDS:2 [Entrophospora candida]